MKIKVCGMRDAKNIEALVKLKIDFIGFIFHEKSPRNVSKKPNITIPKNIKKVGVFVDKPLAFIQEKNLEFDLDYIQLHGKESPEFCLQLKELGLKIIKAFNINTTFDFETLKAYETNCDYLLFDAFGKQAGGNGVVFNWQLLEKYKGKTAFLLSGGINNTMKQQIKDFKHKQFVGIDINSGFEQKPAWKDVAEIDKFIKALKK
jgi:phosphoribosylanthranilate isomerase